MSFLSKLFSKKEAIPSTVKKSFNSVESVKSGLNYTLPEGYAKKGETNYSVAYHNEKPLLRYIAISVHKDDGTAGLDGKDLYTELIMRPANLVFVNEADEVFNLQLPAINSHFTWNVMEWISKEDEYKRFFYTRIDKFWVFIHFGDYDSKNKESGIKEAEEFVKSIRI